MTFYVQYLIEHGTTCSIVREASYMLYFLSVFFCTPSSKYTTFLIPDCIINLTQSLQGYLVI